MGRWCTNRPTVELVPAILHLMVVPLEPRMTGQPAAHKNTPWFSVIEPSMPYKANAARRHKFTKAKYRVTNWPDYDAALVRRGSLTVWVTDEAIAAWHAPSAGAKCGGQRVYSDLAIETGLALPLVLHLGLRQTLGALGSIADFLDVDVRIPDHTTFSRRGDGLTMLTTGDSHIDFR